MTHDLKAYRQGNKAAWNASAQAHAQGDGWNALLADVARPGFSVLDQTLTDVLARLDLQGKTVVQIGCNNARELLSLPALGIVPVLGIDQSEAFLGQGAVLAKAAGRNLRLVAADIYELPDGLGTYDLALITIGVLNWMPDLTGFFRAVAGLLKDGGTLVIYETHPMLEMFEPEGEAPFDLVHNYFESEPIEVPELIVYDGATDEKSGAVGYWFIHPLGEIITAISAAGLRIAALTEYAHSNREPEYDKYEEWDVAVPMSYTLIAKRD